MESTSHLVSGKLPCIHCGSTDAYHLYSDGHGYCFSCDTYDPPNKEEDDPDASIYDYLPDDDSDPPWDVEPDSGREPVVSAPIMEESKYEYREYRGLTPDTLRFYDAPLKCVDGVAVAIGYPYGDSAVKARSIVEKKFHFIGTPSNTLFGMERFAAGSAKSLTITEGENDAMAVYQMLGSKFPSVSLPNGAAGAKKSITANLKYIKSFDKIYLCFDNDEPGQKAKAEVAQIIGYNKCYDVNLTKYKDAHDHLEKGDAEAFREVWYNARKIVPDGILSSFNDFDKAIDDDEVKPSVPFPFPELQKMTKGIRLGEVYLFTAQEGIGKTEVFRAIEYHLLQTTDANIGILHLEESKVRTIKGLANYDLKSPVHLDETVDKQAIKDAFRRACKSDDRVYIYSHFGSDDPQVIIDAIHFLVTACDCKYIFFDHITMVVSGLETDDERRVLDRLSTKLATMANDLGFALFMVSHVNDDDRTRGSRNISKVAHTHIHLDRDKEASDPVERNTTRTLIKKNRFASMTGPSSRLVFNPETFLLDEYDPVRDMSGAPPVN